MKISSPRIYRNACFSISLLLGACVAQAATVTGTVTNKTTGKPSAGDSVVLVDVQAGMADAATATTDSKGQYSLQSPGPGGAFLVRVNHQGATYFIAAPQGGTGGDVTVYDVAAKVDGVAIDADMLLLEGAGGMLRVQERYLVRNTSLPPKAQFSDKTFEVVLPPDAELDGASATRPGGLGTNTRLVPLSQKGHYSFNVPIQPDQGQKETLFEVQYHISYSGKYTFKPQLEMPADNLVIYVPKSMTFSGAQGAEFQSVQDDPRVLTNIAKNVHPGQAIAFTVGGEGQMPRDAKQSSGMSPQAAMGMGGGAPAGSDTTAPASAPGGGIGNPIGTPDPLTKYKWWILGGLTLLLAVAAIYLLRSRGGSSSDSLSFASVPDLEGRPLPAVPRSIAPVTDYSPPPPRVPDPVTHTPVYKPSVSSSKAALLGILKEELFAIESEKLSGTLSPEEYAEIKIGLEAVLKRALKKT
ncbi:MAG TPA: carboxypeptidase-like regulatory domain-containing protein [Terracidiphilus sp.]|jgi:hypothetical protein